MLRKALLPALIVCALATSTQADATIYSNNFSAGAGSEWSNNTTSVDNSVPFLGGTNGFGNGTDVLTLTSVAPHTSVTVTFDFYAIQSWDGNGPQGGNSPSNPDAFELSVNGSVTPIFDASFANYTVGNTQSFGGPDGLGGYITTGSFAPRTGETSGGDLGFGTGDFGDATYLLTFTFPDTSSTLALDFTSTQDQGPGDEGWGLGNVNVSIAGSVPEPASIMLLAAGISGTMLRRSHKSI
jgi:hypothetical protein